MSLAASSLMAPLILHQPPAVTHKPPNHPRALAHNCAAEPHQVAACRLRMQQYPTPTLPPTPTHNSTNMLSITLSAPGLVVGVGRAPVARSSVPMNGQART